MNAQKMPAGPPSPGRRSSRLRTATAIAIEPLEPRIQLSGSPGQTLATAENLGLLGAGTQSFSGVVEAADPDNFYSFQVASTTDVTLALDTTADQGDVSSELLFGTVVNGAASELTYNGGQARVGTIHQVLPPGAITSTSNRPASLLIR